MTKRDLNWILGGGATAIAFTGLLAIGLPANAQSEGAGSTYRAALRAANGGGASGEAVLKVQGRNLLVHITARGLEAGGIHLSHIHGLSEGDRAVDSQCPTSAQDRDGDGFIELAEGATVYGPILTDFMNIDPDQDGNVDFTTTVSLSGNASVIPLNMRHIVIHGMSVGTAGAGTPGEVNGTAGYKVLLPTLCGEIAAGPNDSAMKFRTP